MFPGDKRQGQGRRSKEKNKVKSKCLHSMPSAPNTVAAAQASTSSVALLPLASLTAAGPLFWKAFQNLKTDTRSEMRWGARHLLRSLGFRTLGVGLPIRSSHATKTRRVNVFEIDTR